MEVTVKILGIAGPSGCGKSTVAEHITETFNSPLKPISMDLFFNRQRCRELGTWETPEGLDSTLFCDTLDGIKREIIAAVIENDESKCRSVLENTCRGDIPLKRRIQINQKSDAVSLREVWGSNFHKHINIDTEGKAAQNTIVIVVEGFLLLAFPEVAKRLDAVLLIESPPEFVSCMRFLRSRTRAGISASNAVDRLGWLQQRVDYLEEQAPEQLKAVSAPDRHDVLMVQQLFRQFGVGQDEAATQSSQNESTTVDHETSDAMEALMEQYMFFRKWYFADVHHHFAKYWPKQCKNAAFVGEQRVATVVNGDARHTVSRPLAEFLEEAADAAATCLS